MQRYILPAIVGLVLGGIIHLVLVLALPGVINTSAWDRISELSPSGPGPVILAPPLPGQPNPLRLDPELVYAACRLDLTAAPARMFGTLPQSFWSVAVYGQNGQVIYATTNRDGLGRVLDLGVFTPAQVRLLAEQRYDVTDDLIIVESDEESALAVVRLAPPHPSARPRYEAQLKALGCKPISLI